MNAKMKMATHSELVLLDPGDIESITEKRGPKFLASGGPARLAPSKLTPGFPNWGPTGIQKTLQGPRLTLFEIVG